MSEETSVRKQTTWNWLRVSSFVGFVAGGSMVVFTQLRLVALLLIIASGALLLVNRYQTAGRAS